MDRLWTPWRFEYIRELGNQAGCVFCRILSEGQDEANLILHRAKTAFAILNLFPYTSGHVLIVLNRHVPFLRDADRDELRDMLELAQRCERALEAEYHPEGYNLGFNLGRAAGAGVDQHLHMHLLPRWTGDASFISVVGETRVLPEEVTQTYHRLRPYFSA